MLIDVKKDRESTLSKCNFKNKNKTFAKESLILGKIMLYDALINEAINLYARRFGYYSHYCYAGKDLTERLERFEKRNKTNILPEHIKEKYLHLNELRGEVFHIDSLYYLFYKNDDEVAIETMHDVLTEYFLDLSNFLEMIQSLK